MKQSYFVKNKIRLIYASPLTYDGVVLWGSIFLYNIHLIGYLALHKCGLFKIIVKEFRRDFIISTLENSFMYIIAIYVFNTVLPVPILFAMSTVRFFILKSRIAVVPLFLLLVGMDLAVVSFYYVLIKRRRINIC